MSRKEKIDLIISKMIQIGVEHDECFEEYKEYLQEYTDNELEEQLNIVENALFAMNQ